MNPYEQYRNVSLTMATPGRLIVRLYDRAIQDIEGAGEAVRSGDPERRGQLIRHAQEILSELLGALDMKAGGEVASSLSGLYLYMNRRILEANRISSASALEEAAGLLREIREGWEGISRPEEGPGAQIRGAGADASTPARLA